MIGDTGDTNEISANFSCEIYRKVLSKPAATGSKDVDHCAAAGNTSEPSSIDHIIHSISINDNDILCSPYPFSVHEKIAMNLHHEIKPLKLRTSKHCFGKTEQIDYIPYPTQNITFLEVLKGRSFRIVRL